MLNVEKELNNFMQELVIIFDPENAMQVIQNTPKMSIVKNSIVHKVPYINTTHSGIMKSLTCRPKFKKLSENLILSKFKDPFLLQIIFLKISII